MSNKVLICVLTSPVDKTRIKEAFHQAQIYAGSEKFERVSLWLIGDGVKVLSDEYLDDFISEIETIQEAGVYLNACIRSVMEHDLQERALNMDIMVASSTPAISKAIEEDWAVLNF
jgi:hypothetical protein